MLEKYQTANVGKSGVKFYVARKDRLHAPGSRLIGYHTSDLGGMSGCVGPLICYLFWGRGYSYWNYMPFEILGDRDGRYKSASSMNDWVDKQSKSQQPT